MAALAAPKALLTAGTVLSGIGGIAEGISGKNAADDEADQLRRRAKTRRAEAGAAARDESRQGRIKASRAQAVAAASGASLADPTFVNLMADIEAEGEYRALARMYEGETAARADEDAARAAKKRGRAKLFGGLVKGAASVMTGVGTLKTKYA